VGSEGPVTSYRLLDRPGRAWIVSALRLPLAAPAARAIFRKLAFFVIVPQKAAS
jgi:hypothetical protein